MGRLSRLWVRLWLLAGVSVLLSVTLLLTTFVGLQFWLEHVARDRVPPAVSAEMRRLEALGQTLDARYTILFDRYLAPYNPINDYALLALLTLLSIAIAGAFAFVMARRISRPISDVAEAAGRIAEGDLLARVNPEGTSGETAELVTRFNAMASEIEQYERERRVLTAGIAHELRTPLTIIKGRLHAMIDDILPLTKDEAVRLLRNTDQLSHLVEDLRTLAHADAGELALDLQMVDVDDVVENFFADLRAGAQERNIGLIHMGNSVEVCADPLRLTQILSNLLTNALKHAPAGSEVAVRTRHEGTRFRIMIEDDGEGLPTTDLPQLFIPFWRGEADRAAGHPGSGMGLTLAQMLAEAQGGQLLAENRAGRGARFTLILPA